MVFILIFFLCIQTKTIDTIDYFEFLRKTKGIF